LTADNPHPALAAAKVNVKMTDNTNDSLPDDVPVIAHGDEQNQIDRTPQSDVANAAPSMTVAEMR
jgi:hypothetical protein